jgi:hypothetical protein
LAIAGTAVMGCLEEKLRQSLQRDARRCLEELLNDPSVHVPGDQTQPGESCHAQRLNTVESLFGPLTLRRNYYYKRQDETGGRVPLDESLGIIEGCTPGLARLMSRAGALEPYEDASQSLAIYSGIDIDGRRIQRLVQRLGPQFAQWTQSQPAPTALAQGTTFYVEADGTGIPVRPEETVDRKGKGEDGQARTREIKLGVIFRQETQKPVPVSKKHDGRKTNAGKTPSDSRPERIEGSTRYVSTTGNSQELGRQLRQLARSQGLSLATLVVFLGDGAAWVWELARVWFPMAKLILDFYHAAEHVGLLADTLFGQDTPLAKSQRDAWIHILRDEPDGVDEVIRRATAAMPRSGKKRRLTRKALDYFHNNRDKMRYWEYQAQGLFFGSGVVEAGCKTVVGQRLKQSGMFWGLPGAHNILDIRCVLENGQFDAFWNRFLPGSIPRPKAA